MFNNNKKVIIGVYGVLFSIGYYRGIQQYKYNYITNKQNLSFNDYFCLTTFGLINASLYINPALTGFAIYDEYQKLNMIISNTYEEKLYYSSSFEIK